MIDLGELIGTQLCKDTGMCASNIRGSTREAAAAAAPVPQMCSDCKKIVKEVQVLSLLALLVLFWSKSTNTYPTEDPPPPPPPNTHTHTRM
jgi:hypothetical protein